MPLTRAITALRRACATGRDAQTVTVRRGHLRELLAAYDLASMRQPAEPLRIEDDTAYLGCMYCVNEGACPCAESECHYPTWERRVERVGPSDAVEALADACGAGWRRA
jgi:hypothetical protein